jgi:hypothetical protein
MSTQTSVNPYFSPTQLSGCALWLDANDPNGNGLVSTPGSVLSRWVDKSGSGNTVNANGSPVFSNYQSRNAVYINSNWFSRSASFAIANTTIFFVFSISNPIGDKSYFQVGANPNNGGGDTTTFFSDANVTRPGGTPTGRIYFGSGGTTLLSTQFPTATATDVVPYCIQTARITSSPFVENFTNGSLQNSRTGTVTRVSHNNLIVGSSNGGWQWTGYMSEIIMYTSALQDSQRQQVEGYLAWKWNLQSSLANNHPYKSSPIPPLLNPSRSLPLTLQNPFFTPRQISGCGLWLDGADPNGNNIIPSGGTSLSTWVDKSGAGANGIAIGTAPVFAGGGVTFSAGAYNTSYSASLTNESLFIVFRYTKPNAQQALVCQTGDGGRATTLLAGASTAAFESSVYNVAFGAVSPSTTVPQNAIGLGELVTTNSNMAIWYNGTSFGTPTTVTITAGRTSVVGGAYNGGSPNTSQYLGGSIFEVIGYTVSLSASQRQLVEGYLAWKWGFQASLPANHPYKRSPIPPLLNPPSANPIVRFASWQPSQISALNAWFDGADPNGTGILPRQNTAISTWVNKRSGGTNATAVGTGALFSSNGMTFATPKYYTTSIPYSSNYSIFLVATNTSVTQCYFMARNSIGGGRGPTFTQGYGTATRLQFYEGDGGVFPIIAETPSSPFLTSIDFSSLSYLRTYYNGVNASNIVPTATYNAAAWDTIGQAGAGANTAYYNGTMKELIFFNSVLSTQQRQQVEGYLAWKWGLVGNLPNNHPYKKWPPSP